MIDFARAADDLDQRWYPHQIDTVAPERASRVWLCGGCTARVTAHRSYTRANGTRVLAHFATWPRPGDQLTPHDPSCGFLPPVREPPAGTTPRTSGASPRAATAWLLAAATTAGPEGPDGPVESSWPGTGVPPTPRLPGVGDIASSKRPTIGSAHRVLDLLRLFDEEPMQMLRFTAVWRAGAGSSAIELGWGDLYYPPGRHHLLLQRAHDESLPAHPVAVSGPVQRVARTLNRRRGTEDLSVYFRLARAGPRDRLVLRGSPDVMPAVERSQVVLAFASWANFVPDLGREGTTTTYCTAWITQSKQVITLAESESYH